MKKVKAADAPTEPASKRATRSQSRKGKAASVGRMRLEASSSTMEDSRQAKEVEVISADGSSDCMIEEALAPAPPKPQPVCIIDIDSSDDDAEKLRKGPASAAINPQAEQAAQPSKTATTEEKKKKQKKTQKQPKSVKAKSQDPRKKQLSQAPDSQMQLEPLLQACTTAAQPPDTQIPGASPSKETATVPKQLSKRLNNLGQYWDMRETCRKLEIDETTLRKSMQEAKPREKPKLVMKTKNTAMLIKLKKLINSAKKHGPNSIVDYLLMSRDRLIGFTLINSQASDPLISVNRLDSRSAC